MALVFKEGVTGFPERPGTLYFTTVSNEVDARIKAALKEWVLRVSYQVTYDDDEGSSTFSDVRYKELYEKHIVLAHDRPVGIMLEETVHYHNSNSTDKHIYVLYFRDAPDHQLMLEGARSGNHYVEGTAFYSLKRRAELGNGVKVDTATTQFIPVPNVF